MKRQFFLLAMALMLSLTCVTRSFAADAVTTNNVTTTERMEQIKSRVEEIKNMDKTNLTRDERKELKTELKNMHKEAREARRRNGVFLSVGAILIIILILILVL